MDDLFPDDHIGVPLPGSTNHHQWPSSSSSSFRSLSTGGSPEYSTSLLMSNMMTSTNNPRIQQAIRPTSTTITQDHQTIQTYNDYLAFDQSLNPESDEAVMTRAMLAVISSGHSPHSSSSSNQIQQTPRGTHESAFKRYACHLGPYSVQTSRANRPRQNMLKHAISILRNMYLRKIEEQTQAASRPTTSSQLQHKMSERKRREKLNQTFQQLRSLLPPGTKKDKASVLSNTRDYLSSLKSEVVELKEKNNFLEARIADRREAVEEAAASTTSNERISIKVTQSSNSTSEEQEINLQVTVRGECNVVDLVIRVLEFLKQMKNVRLIFMEADTTTESQQTSAFNRIMLRMRIEERGGDWDESAFRVAMERLVVANVAS